MQYLKYKLDVLLAWFWDMYYKLNIFTYIFPNRKPALLILAHLISNGYVWFKKSQHNYLATGIQIYHLTWNVGCLILHLLITFLATWQGT